MDTACERVDAGCRATGKQLSEDERQAAVEGYFRVEAAELGMAAEEIEGRLCVHAETQRILKEILEAEPKSGG